MCKSCFLVFVMIFSLLIFSCDSGDTANSADSGDTANSADSGDIANSADSGDTGSFEDDDADDSILSLHVDVDGGIWVSGNSDRVFAGDFDGEEDEYIWFVRKMDTEGTDLSTYNMRRIKEIVANESAPGGEVMMSYGFYDLLNVDFVNKQITVSQYWEENLPEGISEGDWSPSDGTSLLQLLTPEWSTLSKIQTTSLTSDALKRIMDSSKNIYEIGHDKNTVKKVNPEGVEQCNISAGTNIIRSLTVKDDFIYITGTTDDRDVFLVKYGSDCTEVWSRQWGTDGIDDGSDLYVSQNNIIYVTGVTSGLFNELDTSGGLDVFVSKFLSDGTVVWSRQWGSSEADFAQKIDGDNSNDIYVTGVTQGSFESQDHAGKDDIFLIKIDENGMKQWAKQWGTVEIDQSLEMVIDGTSIYLAGNTNGGLDGNENAGGCCLLSGSGEYPCHDIFVKRVSFDGTPIWTRQFGSAPEGEWDACTKADDED